MKNLILPLTTVLCLAVYGDETNVTATASQPVPEATAPAPAALPAAEPAPVANPAPATEPAPAPAQTLREADTDEIDLEEVDDSAEAAKKPTIKATDGETNSRFVDIECDDATLSDIIRQFRKTTGANILAPDSTNLSRRVSATLKHVPWLTAMQSLLNSRGFRVEERGDIYFISEDLQAIPTLTKTFILNHASCEDLAKLFNANYAQKDKPIATAFTAANVVVVTAPESTIIDCERIIKSVDKAVAQIYIEARFIELSSAALRKLGIDWSSLESWRVSASDLHAGWEHNNGESANYGVGTTSRNSNRSITDTQTDSKSSNVSASGDSITSTSASSSPTHTRTSTQTDTDNKTGLYPGSILDAANAGISAADMGWKNAYGFSGQLSASDFSLAMSAFESLGEGRIFSNPKVIVSNGKEALVDMTTKFPNVEITSQRNNSTTTAYTDYSARISVIPGEKGTGIFAGDIFYSWGITLSVKPRISPDGLISVVITPSISQLGTTGADSDGFYSITSSGEQKGAAYSKFPVIDMKKITTEFTMKDGATAVIGGLSKTTEEDIDTGIPYLRKIPWIGQKLFGWTSRQKVQKEIIVCVTVGIADPASLPNDIGLPKNAVMGREYVEGRKLEPGDRAGGAAAILDIDTRDLSEQHADPKDKPKEAPKGTITITPSKEEN